MKVSVIISAYNMAEYIQKCIMSVLNQTYCDFEIILINDGSTDNTDVLCRELCAKDERIVYISKKNEGLSVSRNKGIKIAKGEYLTFLDADDLFENDYLEKLVCSAKDYDADVVIGDVRFVEKRDDGLIKKNSIVRLHPGRIQKDLECNFFGKCRTFFCGKLYRHNLFEKYDIWLPNHNYEDISVTSYLIHKAEAVVYSPGAFYCYLRNRDGSIINDFSQLHYTKISLEELLGRFESDGSYELNKKALMHLYWGQTCHVFNVTNGKFAKEKPDEIDYVRKDILSSFLARFPETERIAESRYYASGDCELEDAIKHIILDDNQLTNDIESSDIIVKYGKENKTEYRNERIVVTIMRKHSCDNATDSWNDADTVLDQIFSYYEEKYMM